MLSVDKFPYPWKQIRGNKLIPCSNNIYDILNHFCSFKIPAITLIWPKSLYKHSVARSYRSGKESGRRKLCHSIHGKNETILFKHEYRTPTLKSCCDVISDVINIKSTFSDIVSDDFSVSDVKMNLSKIFRNLKKWPPFCGQGEFF